MLLKKNQRICKW